ncbi:MAG: hypothetical protein ACRD40_14500 [Candidatus Acidiferrales bacterium]
MKYIALLFVCLFVAAVLLVSLHAGKKMTLQYAAAPADDDSALSPSTHVCITVYDAKPDYKCGYLRIGMDENAVGTQMGGTQHATTTDTTADGTVQYWRYVGFPNDDKHVLLMFVDGRLNAIQN